MLPGTWYMVWRTSSRIRRTKGRLIEACRASRSVGSRALSLALKLPKVWRPPPVKNPSPGFAEKRRSSAASSIAGRLRSVRGGEVVDRPAREAVLGVHLDPAQRRRVERGEPGVEFGDELEVGGQHAQLGGGAELELAALVDVERLVGGVGLHPHAIAAHGALHQGEAVAHRAKRGRVAACGRRSAPGCARRPGRRAARGSRSPPAAGRRAAWCRARASRRSRLYSEVSSRPARRVRTAVVPLPGVGRNPPPDR